MSQYSFYYIICLKNLKTGIEFNKMYSSPYLFRKALSKYKHSKKLKVVYYYLNSS